MDGLKHAIELVQAREELCGTEEVYAHFRMCRACGYFDMLRWQTDAHLKRYLTDIQRVGYCTRQRMSIDPRRELCGACCSRSLRDGADIESLLTEAQWKWLYEWVNGGNIASSEITTNE